MRTAPTFATLMFAVVALAGAAQAQAPGRFEIVFVDVLGGAATLLKTPEGESVLIDTGWPGQGDRDPARIEYALKTVLGLDRVNHLVTTHWHMDHFGGVEGVARRLTVDRYWDRGLPDPSAPGGDSAEFPDGPKPDDPLGVAYRKATEGKRKALRAGDTLPLRGSVEALVLASGGKVIASPGGPANPSCGDAPADLAPDPSDNARSLAFRFKLGKFAFFDAGDLTWNVEKQLACPTDRVGPVDLYQVTHHGMAISNHPTLLRTLAPTVVVMNNGPRKGGDAATVARLRTLPSVEASYQLHKNAATSAAENVAPEFIANADPEGGRYVRVSVEPDGSSYTVKLGDDGPVRRFATR